MKHTHILAAALSVIILSGCSTETAETEITETTTETSATTFNEYFLTRGWDGDELLASIFYLGEYHPLPMSLESNPDYTFSDGILYFPDGSYATAKTDENGNIISLSLTRTSAPLDFSIYGVDFNARQRDIPEKIGFANYITENDDMLYFVFTDGGITLLVFEFSEDTLVSVTIEV